MAADPSTSLGVGGWPPPVLDPAGPFAGPIKVLSWTLFAMGGTVLAIVLVCLFLALFGPRKWRALIGNARLVWIGGLAFPVVVLSALLVWGLTLTNHVDADPKSGEMRVRVTGEMWWWRVDYLDAAGRPVMRDANEIHIPTGRPVLFELEATDVIHSFWIPRLGGKKDMIPGRRNILRLQADAAGTYKGQCAEFCGGPHALMGLVVIAHEPTGFDAWRAARAARQAPQPSRGAEVFTASGCGACHTVAGTAANGAAGPDLTYVGSRTTLGAGILPNNHGTLAGWIANSQSIKPGNRMPAYPVLNGADLRAVATYLSDLR